MIIIAITAHKVSPDGYRAVQTCEEIIFIYNSVNNSTSVASLYERYPACHGYNKSSMGDVHVIVNARLGRAYPEERVALLDLVFGVSGWAALVLHFAVTEIYLNYTKDEADRLKKVSTMRRKAAGLGGPTGSVK
jgi:hypothetical protein